ncbi:MAG: hypothetical protein ABIX01_06575 [Chitinophagaceae bacterium]
MKKTTSFICSLAVVLALNATVRTVSNSPATLAQFNTIQSAVNASAVSGDTILVHGSPSQYAGFTISNKQLTIIGPGWSPDKSLAFTALVLGSNITGATSSNSEIQGLTFVGGLAINSAHPDNMRIIRNNFAGTSISMNQGGTTYTGYLFEGNLFDNGGADATASSTYQNFIFQNNYFYESGCCRDGNLAGGWFNCVNVLFNHNLWFGPGSSTRNITDGNSNRFMTFTNNIFVRRNFNGRVSSSTFNNNITFNAGVNNPWATASNVDGGGNIENQDPQMVAQAGVNAGTNDATADYSILAGPANNTGTDGKDIGLLYDAVGSLNWVNSRNSRLPRIFNMNITNPTISSGGTLQVVVNARKSN